MTDEERRTTEEEMRAYYLVLRKHGSPTQLDHKLNRIEEMTVEYERRQWLFSSIKKIAGWAAIVSAGWFAIKGFISETGMWGK